MRVVARRPRADDGRLRVGTAGRQSRVRGEAQRQRADVRARARAAAPRAPDARSRARQPPPRVQLRARLHHQRHPARRAGLRARAGGRTRHARREQAIGGGDRPRDAPQRPHHAVEDRRVRRPGDDRRAPVRSGRRGPDRAAARARRASAGDVLDAQHEKEMFPDDVADQAEQADAIKEPRPRGLALARAVGALKGAAGRRCRAPRRRS